jgi:glyoxylase-like metal-dependent hydrolase (beta-lactamase superfamily II)
MAHDAHVSRRNLLLGAGSAGLALGLGGVRSAFAQSAPTAPKAPYTVRESKLGELRLVVIQDAQMQLPTAQSPFQPMAKPGEREAVLEKRGLRRDLVSLDVNSLLIISPNGEITMIDAGFGGAMGRTQQAIIEGSIPGISASMIKNIVVTHVHGDHYGGLLNAAGESAFPNARILLAEREHDFWTKEPDLSKGLWDENSKKGAIAGAQNAIKVLKKQLDLVQYGKEILPGIALELAAGHTGGHSLVRISNGKESMIHAADWAHHFALMVQNPDWKVAFDADPVQGSETRKKLQDRFAKEKTRLFGTHMPLPGFGRILKSGGKFSWEIEPWVY